MLKKLYGLFIYKLQMTSYFSIMERVSGFLLLGVLYYFFIAEIFANTFFVSFNFNSFFLLISLLIVFFLAFHVVNGLRIYVMSIYYYINLKKQPLTLDTLYSLSIVEKNKFLKMLLNSLKNLLNYARLFGVKSNYSFLILIFFVYILFILIILV